MKRFRKYFQKYFEIKPFPAIQYQVYPVYVANTSTIVFLVFVVDFVVMLDMDLTMERYADCFIRDLVSIFVL